MPWIALCGITVAAFLVVGAAFVGYGLGVATEKVRWALMDPVTTALWLCGRMGPPQRQRFASQVGDVWNVADGKPTKPRVAEPPIKPPIKGANLN